MITTYPIHEMFATFQGEGVHMGRSAFFVRTYGCPVHCPWCDSAGTWHPKFVPKEIQKLTAEEIAHAVLLEEMDLVVVTGGEPTVHDLKPLVGNLHRFGIRVHLETSGAFPILSDFDWITLSPKKWKHPLRESVVVADEFKIIVEAPEDIDFYHGMLLSLGLPNLDIPIWLHPEWSHRNNPDLLGAIANAVKRGGSTFRAGWQLHKLYQVDKLDQRSQIPVPLGGDPNKGL